MYPSLPLIRMLWTVFGNPTGSSSWSSSDPPLFCKSGLTFLSAPPLCFPHPAQGFVLPCFPLSTTSLVVALPCAGSLLKFSGWKKHLLVTLNLVSAALVLTETSQPCGKGTDVVFGKLELTPFLYQGPPLWPWVNHKRLNLKAPFGAQPPHTDFQHPGCSASGAAPLDFHPHSLFLQDTTPTLSHSCTATPTVQPQGNIYQSPPSTKHWEGRCVERCCFYTFSIEEEGTFPPHVLSFQHFFLPNSSVSPSETFP